MGEFFQRLFDTTGWPARWNCGTWSDTLGWLHILSDIAIWIAYMGIPLGLAIVVTRRRDVPFPRALWLFAAFILSCGFTHLVEAGIFYWPVYRLSGLMKLITAVISLVTMFVMTAYVSRALHLPSFRTALGDLAEDEESRNRIVELEEERSRLRLAVEAAGAGQWDWLVDDDTVTLDTRAKALLGMPHTTGRIKLEQSMSYVHEDDRERIASEMQVAIKSGRSPTFRFRSGDGRYILSKCSVLRDDAGNALRLSGVMLDITQQEEQDELLRVAVESAPCGVLLVDDAGKIRLANQNASELFGWSIDELLGSEVERLVPTEARDRHVELRRSFRSDHPGGRPMSQRDVMAKRRDGTEFPVEVLLNPVRFRGERGVISTVIDISDRKRAESEMRDNAAKLQSRNEALDEFAYMVSHDLKAPLRGILMVTEWLEADHGPQLGEEIQEQLVLLRSRAHAMHSLISGALAYARANREEGEVLVVDSGAVLDEVLNLLDAPEGVVHRRDLPKLRCDRDHLTKILMNLVGNALTYGVSDDPRVDVFAERTEEEGRPVWRFCVADNGPGIDARFHDRVFRMFKRLPGAKGDSSGVGLAIVKRLVERSGGTCWLDSEPGAGARFFFTIPSSE